MKIAVTMSTFQRQDGKSPFYLKRALDSVFDQRHQDFFVFLVGDNYENKEELESIVKNYSKEKIKTYNLKESIERQKYSCLENKAILWSCAGLTAINVSIKTAINKGFYYISHLDHDDYWTKDHLYLINQELEKGADFVCAKSTYGNGYLPEIESIEKVLDYLPTPGKIINSATCFNYNKIPFLYRNMYELCGEPIPSDADLWDRMSRFIIENGLVSKLINIQTCFHTEEGYILYGGQ